MLRGDLHTLAGPYALDALGRRDRARFERHLTRCGSCQEEARGLQEASAALAAVTATVPPAQLRERVLAAAATTRQLPPSVLDGPGARAHPQAARARRAAFSPVLVPRLAVAIGGAITLLALAFGSLTVTDQHRLGMEQARSRQIAAIMNAPDHRMMSARSASGGTVTVIMSHRDRALVLTTARLPALPHGKAYQVWLGGPGGMRSQGMLPAAHLGMTPPVIVSGLRAHDRVVLTVEPQGGAPHPGTRPVVTLTLP